MQLHSDFLFTYGTLMSGFDNPFASKLRNSSVFYGKGIFPGTLYRVSWYPGAVFNEDSDGQVFGEIYHLTDPANLLPALDEYEDVLEDEKSSLYLRKIVPIMLGDQTILPCWVYVYNQPVKDLEVIQSGDFRKNG